MTPAASVARDRGGRYTEDIIRGSDDFLFHRFDGALEQLCTAAVPTDRQLAQWVTSFETSYAWCAAKQASYISLIIPERHVVYADKLPPGFAISPRRPVMRLLDAMDPNLRRAVLYPVAELASARGQAEVFLKTDEHLNLNGYYRCYHALLDRLQRDVQIVATPQEGLPARRVHVSGNLGMRVDEEPTEDVDYWLAGSDGNTRRIFTKRGPQAKFEIFHNSDRTKPVALIFGDSNADALRHLLTPHFSRTLIVYNCHHLLHELVRSERPDVVIHIMSELRLGRSSIDGAISQQVVDQFFSERPEPLPSVETLLMVDLDECGEGQSFLGEGWSHAEATHTWMVGATSVFRLPRETSSAVASEAGGHRLDLLVAPHLASRSILRRQRFIISYGHDGAWTELGRFEVDQEVELHMSLPQLDLPSDRECCLKFEHPDGFAPIDDGQADARVLSLAVKRIGIVRATTLAQVSFTRD